MNGIADRLVVAAEGMSDLRGALGERGSEEDLATTQREGIGRAQSCHQCVAFGVRQGTNEDRYTHNREDTTFL